MDFGLEEAPEMEAPRLRWRPFVGTDSVLGDELALLGEFGIGPDEDEEVCEGEGAEFTWVKGSCTAGEGLVEEDSDMEKRTPFDRFFSKVRVAVVSDGDEEFNGVGRAAEGDEETVGDGWDGGGWTIVLLRLRSERSALARFGLGTFLFTLDATFAFKEMPASEIDLV